MKKLSADFLHDEVKSVGWTDVHTHLNFLDITPEQAVQTCKDFGVDRIITIGTEPEDLPVVLELSQKFSPNVFCTIGIHPHEGKVYDESVEKFLRANAQNPRVVALGEMGLDYYYNNSSHDEQKKAFRAQMGLAAEFQLPVEIHTRDADPDTIEILREYKGKVRGIIHCFSGTRELAHAALDCDYNLSFSGIVTFKNAELLRDICKETPLDRMHVETDAPFLAPVPVRGKKNQPNFVLYVAQFVSELKGVALPDFCQQMKLNADQMFPRLLSTAD